MRTFAIHLAIVAAVASTAHAQTPPPLLPEPPLSMSQPHRLRWVTSATAGYGFEREKPSGRLVVDVVGEGILPQLRALAPVMSMGVGIAGGKTSVTFGGALALLWLRFGLDLDAVRNDWVPQIALQIPVRRGGPFGRGDWLRVDYRPVDRDLQVGFTFNNPFTKYRMTRPIKTYTELPYGRIPGRADDALAIARGAEVQAALAEINDAVKAMDQLLTPRFGSGADFESTAQMYRQHIRVPGQTFDDWERRYHAALDRSFTIACSGNKQDGRALAAVAERLIFNDVIVPFNRLFGQNKHPRNPAGYATTALHKFDLHVDTLQVDNISVATAHEIFRSTLLSITRTADEARKRWQQRHIFWLRQGRLVWLPINYGLRPEQRDSQDEVDAIVEALTAQAFTDDNKITYMVNEQFHAQLKKTIRETEFYHVIIIHDFRGRYDGNKTDVIGWDTVADGYLRAFTEAIEEIDRGDREMLPQFILYLDETFYQDNKSRKIITYLEHLYDPGGLDLSDNDVAERVMDAQERLRFAIASSPHFSTLPEAQLKQAFKVHASITNPFDPSFVTDGFMRDHRKIVFRDVFENNPAIGVGIFTGQGVGEHYNGPSWEDRSMMVQGPALVAVKTAARKLHMGQGYSAEEVPHYLQPIALDEDAEARNEALAQDDWTVPILTTFNETGYGDKKATVLKAALYNLAWKNAYAYAFDSLWISDFWAGMFLSAALRGAHMFPVAPAAENAPSNAAPTMLLMYDNLYRLMQCREYFADDIANAGGSLDVGLYASDVPVYDVPERVRRFLRAVEQRPSIIGGQQLHPDVVAVLDSIAGTHIAVNDTIGSSHKPFIHLKTQLFMNGQAMNILGFRELRAPFATYLETRMEQVRGLPNEGLTTDLIAKSDSGGATLPAAYASFVSGLPAGEVETPVFMMTIGSHNQDRRGMLLDGEVLIAIAGYQSLITLPDFMLVLGMVEWPQDTDELFRRYPQVPVRKYRRLARFVQDLF